MNKLTRDRIGIWRGKLLPWIICSPWEDFTLPATTTRSILLHYKLFINNKLKIVQLICQIFDFNISSKSKNYMFDDWFWFEFISYKYLILKIRREISQFIADKDNVQLNFFLWIRHESKGLRIIRNDICLLDYWILLIAFGFKTNMKIVSQRNKNNNRNIMVTNKLLSNYVFSCV